jgi:hypothetical protein
MGQGVLLTANQQNKAKDRKNRENLLIVLVAETECPLDPISGRGSADEEADAD